MRNSEFNTYPENQNRIPREIALLDRMQTECRPWKLQKGDLLGSVQNFIDHGTMSGGDAICLENTVLVEQGSCAFIDNPKAHILSPDFTRCVGILIRKPNGVFLAHSTEHDLSLLKMVKAFSAHDDRVNIFLPDYPPRNIGVAPHDLVKLQALHQEIDRLHLKKTLYPWSDFPPSLHREEAYILSISPKNARAIPIQFIADNSLLGYHRVLLNNRSEIPLL